MTNENERETKDPGITTRPEGANEEVDTTVFDELESEVQSYARNFPVIFERAVGAHLYDQEGGKPSRFPRRCRQPELWPQQPCAQEKADSSISSMTGLPTASTFIPPRRNGSSMR